jgi:aspartate-semialdehyde dehydrogenase
MKELETQAREFVAGFPYTTKIFGRQYLFKRLQPPTPRSAGRWLQRGREEDAQRDAQDVDDAKVRVAATCVRVPTLRAHCESINLTFRGSLSRSGSARDPCQRPGLFAGVDDRAKNAFPEPIDAAWQ